MFSTRYSTKHLEQLRSSGQLDTRTWKEALWVGLSLAWIDILAVTAAGVLSIGFFSGVFPTVERGFYCNDVSIAKPFYENVTVPTSTLLAMTNTFPIVLIHIMEVANLCLLPPLKDRQMQTKITLFFHHSTPLITKYVGGFTFMCSMFEMLKAMFGSLRPYFLDACQPEWSKTPCVGHGMESIYVPVAPCKGSDKMVRQARRSFPSGHAAAAFFAATYLVFYSRNVLYELEKYAINNPEYAKKISILKRFVHVYIVCFFLWATFCSYSRVVDYWHHPRDIFGGIVLGVLCSYIFYRDR